MRVRSRAVKPRVVIVIVAVGIAALGGWWSWGSPDRHAAISEPAPPPASSFPPPSAPRLNIAASPTTTTTLPAPTSADPGGSHLRIGRAHAVTSPALIADAIGPRVPLYSQMGDSDPGDVVDNPTFEGLPVTFLVMDRKNDWLNVQISRRPSEATAWVRAADVRLRPTPYKIRVDSDTHHLTLTDNGKTVMDVEVANGTGGTPTPTGTFFIDGIVKLADPTGPYGTYQLSLAAFSDVLRSFGGGNGQIAIHGTDSPGLMGSSVSHGCVRMVNDDVSKLASIVSVGTPVEIA